MYKCVIFDIGDTLAYSRPDMADIIRERLGSLGATVSGEQARRIKKAVDLWIGEQIMREHGGSPRMPDGEFKRNVDRIIFEGALKIHASLNFNTGDLERSEFMSDRRLVAAPDALPVLDYLVQRNYRLGIVSNYDPSVTAFLSENGLAKYFSSIVISGIAGVEKPDVRIMEIGLRELGCKTDECIYIGDHPLDVLCAKASGMAMAWLCDAGDALPEYVSYEADYRISGLRDLTDIL